MTGASFWRRDQRESSVLVMAARPTVPRDLPPPTAHRRIDVFIEGKSDSDVADSNSRNSNKTIEFNAFYITQLRAGCWLVARRACRIGGDRFATVIVSNWITWHGVV